MLACLAPFKTERVQDSGSLVYMHVFGLKHIFLHFGPIYTTTLDLTWNIKDTLTVQYRVDEGSNSGLTRLLHVVGPQEDWWLEDRPNLVTQIYLDKLNIIVNIIQADAGFLPWWCFARSSSLHFCLFWLVLSSLFSFAKGEILKLKQKV